jgi:hypothetical protein
MGLFILGSVALGLGLVWRVAQVWSDHRVRAQTLAAFIAASHGRNR